MHNKQKQLHKNIQRSEHTYRKNKKTKGKNEKPPTNKQLNSHKKRLHP